MRQMGGPTAARVTLAALLLAASTACSASRADRAGPTATVPPEPPATTTTNPYAIPPVIDEAYVNRVLAGLDAVLGDVVRLIVRTKTIPLEAYERMRSVYGDDHWLQLRIDSFQSDMRRNFSGYHNDPGNPTTTVSELLTSNKSCIFARVRRDYSAVGSGSTATSDRNWVALKPLDQARDPKRFNATLWALTYDGFPPDRSQPANPCIG